MDPWNDPSVGSLDFPSPSRGLLEKSIRFPWKSTHHNTEAGNPMRCRSLSPSENTHPSSAVPKPYGGRNGCKFPALSRPIISDAASNPSVLNTAPHGYEYPMPYGGHPPLTLGDPTTVKLQSLGDQVALGEPMDKPFPKDADLSEDQFSPCVQWESSCGIVAGCEICSELFTREELIQSHLRSKRHNKRLMFQREDELLPHDTLQISSEIIPVAEGCDPTPVKSEITGSSIPPTPVSNDDSDVEPPGDLHDSTPLRSDNSLSPTTDDDTDWDEVELTDSLQDPIFFGVSTISKQGYLSPDHVKESLMESVLSLAKQEMISRIMTEFWAIFEPKTRSVRNRILFNLLEENEKVNTDMPCDPCEGGEGSSQNVISESPKSSSKGGQKSQANTYTKRKREAQEDKDENNGDERSPKRPGKHISPSPSPDNNTKFACPYRKRDPRKYGIQNWRPCVLTPLGTVARVKGHLYRHHRIFPCQRCKNLFNDQDAVNLHLKEAKACELSEVEQADGITTEIMEKLRSKKKAQRDQTEADRWREIFRLVFPNEIVPSPYFEAINEEVILSADEKGLADYEEYCRRELPRDFRLRLEEIVCTQTQLIEENIRNQLQNIIRDCQDRVFSRYRSLTTKGERPSNNRDNPHSLMLAPQETMHGSTGAQVASEASLGTLPPPFYQPPSPRTDLHSALQVSDLPIKLSRRVYNGSNDKSDNCKAPEGSDPSDPGYGSNGSGMYSLFDSSLPRSNYCAPPANFQLNPTLELALGDEHSALDAEKDLFSEFLLEDSQYHNPEQSPWGPF